MDNLPVRISGSLLEQIRGVVIPRNTPPKSSLELIVAIHDRDLSVREFSVFLALVDRIYGRLTPKGLRSYAQEQNSQLRISTIRPGSWELVFETMVSKIDSSLSLIILYLGVRYLPELIRSTTTAIKDLATAYHEYEEGRLSRENRRLLREQMRRDDLVQRLTPRAQRQLAALLHTLYAQESNTLPRAARFLNRGLIRVLLRIREGVVLFRFPKDSPPR